MKSSLGSEFIWYGVLFFACIFLASYAGRWLAEIVYLTPRPTTHHELICSGRDLTTTIEVESIDNVFTVWGFKNVVCKLSGG